MNRKLVNIYNKKITISFEQTNEKSNEFYLTLWDDEEIEHGNGSFQLELTDQQIAKLQELLNNDITVEIN